MFEPSVPANFRVRGLGLQDLMFFDTEVFPTSPKVSSAQLSSTQVMDPVLLLFYAREVWKPYVLTGPSIKQYINTQGRSGNFMF